MLIKPTEWTNHHTHRLFHLSMFLSFAMIVCVIFAGQLIMWADAVAEQGDVAITALVPGISAEPSEPVPGGGGNWPFFEPPISVVPAPVPIPSYEPTVDIKPVSPGLVRKKVVIDGQNVNVWVFPNSNLEFSGQTNIPNALISIEVVGSVSIKATTYANSFGRWNWKSAEALPPGMYVIHIYATSPDSLERFATASFIFLIGSPDQSPGKPITSPKPILDAHFFYDLLVYVSKEDKTLVTGQVLDINTRILEYSGSSEPKYVDLEYLIIDSSGATVFQTQETISVTGYTLLSKKFQIAPEFPIGRYTVMARFGKQNRIYNSSDTFEILSSYPVASTVAPVGIFPQTYALIFLSILFLFLAFLELRKIVHHSIKISIASTASGVNKLS